MPSWFPGVSAIFQAYGIPKADWEAILYAESGGNPRAANGNAFGLFQTTTTGQGKGYTETELMNPYTNARLAAPAIAAAYDQGKMLGYRGTALAMYTATHSGHPGTAPSGSILPPTWWQGYGQFQQEAQNVGGYYNSITKSGNTPGPLAGLDATMRNITGSKTGIGASSAGISTQVLQNAGAWQAILGDMKTAQGNIIGAVFNPAKAVQGVLIYLVVIVIAFLMLYWGGSQLWG